MASTVYETEISIGATRNMKSRLAISLPPGQEKASNALGPGEDAEASIWLVPNNHFQFPSLLLD